jgi:ATP-dependent Clp protease adaptor protein ClpS
VTTKEGCFETMISLRSASDWRLDGSRLGGPKEPPGGPPQPPSRRDDGGRGGEGDGEGRTGALTLTRTRTKKPSMYKVLMLNDDYTPMEFVVDVLQHIFQKNREEATEIMLHVHQKGVGVCGVYTYEVAETKVTQTVDYARKNQHPLQCTLEKE